VRQSRPSCFRPSTIVLPSQRYLVNITRERSTVRPYRMAGRVIIAEDDEALAQALGRLLKTAGYPVSVFTNSNDAWDDLKTDGRPRLLITDLVFPSPQVNGMALAAHAGNRHRHIPVIFITGYADLAGRVRRQDDTPLFAKPIQENALLERVLELAPLEC
jgi:FixJ family two-component response regulator